MTHDTETTSTAAALAASVSDSPPPAGRPRARFRPILWGTLIMTIPWTVTSLAVIFLQPDWDARLIWLVCIAAIMSCCLFLPLFVFRRMERQLQTEQQEELAAKEAERKEAARHLIETNEDLRRQISTRLHIERQLQASEARFRALVETTSDFVWEVDADGRYTYASPKVTAILGYLPDDILGRTPFDIMPPEEGACLREIFRQITADKRPFSGLENIAIHKDGHRIVLETSGEPVLDTDGRLLGYRGIDRDITIRKQEQEALLNAKTKAEQADRAKSEFLANMSHELRTPLHAILSFSSFGLKKLASAEREELEKYFFQINSSGKRLLPLINSLLDLSKLEAGKISYQMEEQDLCLLIEDVLEELRLLAEQKNIVCRLEAEGVSSFACFDRERIGQVLRNLLANALRLTGEKRRIDIRLSDSSARTPDGETLLAVTVADQGVGIAPEELEAIFKPFTQGSRTQSGAGGTGLGLAICRRIIGDHGGGIWAENNADGGASFTFTLPRHNRKTMKLGELLIQQGLITPEHLEKALASQIRTPD